MCKQEHIFKTKLFFVSTLTSCKYVLRTYLILYKFWINYPFLFLEVSIIYDHCFAIASKANYFSSPRRKSFERANASSKKY